MFRWLFKALTRKKAIVYWVHVHVSGAPELMSGNENFPPEPVTDQVLKSIRSGTKYPPATLNKLARKFHFKSLADAKAFIGLFGGEAGKKQIDVSSQPAAKPDDFEKWADANPVSKSSSLVDDVNFFQTVMGGSPKPAKKKAVPSKPPAAVPTTEQTLTKAIGIRFDHEERTFVFINRKFKPSEKLPPYAEEKDLEEASQGKNLDNIATLIFRDAAHALKMSAELEKAGYKRPK